MSYLTCFSKISFHLMMMSERMDEASYMYINYNRSHWKITVNMWYICSLPCRLLTLLQNSDSSSYLRFATQPPPQLFSRPCSMVELSSEEEQNLPPQNMPFRHKNYFRLITFLKKQNNNKKTVDKGEALKTKKMLPFLRDTDICKENLHL